MGSRAKFLQGTEARVTLDISQASRPRDRSGREQEVPRFRGRKSSMLPSSDRAAQMATSDQQGLPTAFHPQYYMGKNETKQKKQTNIKQPRKQEKLLLFSFSLGLINQK